jgi:hypothetical protein
MRKSVPNNQIRALAMAMAGATVAAVATMFVPVAVLEGITGATGLSELVPAARAPLGDTARALIAFGAGAFTLAMLAYFLLRLDGSSRQSAPSVPVSDWAGEDETPSFRDRLAKIKLPSMAMPNMPWTKGEDDITELADLPKLRNGDSHPDAPPRRPLIASQDLPIVKQVERTDAGQEAVELPAANEDATPEKLPEPPPAKAEVAPVADIEPTLAEMVAQLEAAVAERQTQLAELEAVAIKLAAARSVGEPMIVAQDAVPAAEHMAQNEVSSEPMRLDRPPLEAVPSASVRDDDIDSALASALATLHRMNATGR